MSRVKLLRSEIEENDLPAYCMICGDRPAQVQHPSTLAHVPFPLSLFGLLGRLITPKRVTMNIPTCEECKNGYRYEVSMGIVWDLLRTLAVIALFYAVFVQTSSLPKSLLLPAVALFSTLLLQFFYFWTIGKKNAIRLMSIDKNAVGLELPSGKWGVHYTTYKREKNSSNRTMRPPGIGGSFAPAAPPPGGTAAPPATAPPPTAPPSMAPSTIAPAPTPAPSSSAGGVLEGADLATIPTELPEFLATVKLGDADLLADALDRGADYNETLANGMNALHLAAISGGMQVADLLIRRRVPVNSTMEAGLTPLHLAVQSNNQAMVGLLLAKGADPNLPNAQGLTPLHWCAAVPDGRLDHTNRHKMAALLVKGGGDLTVRDAAGRTPAEIARENGHEKVAEAFSL